MWNSSPWSVSSGPSGRLACLLLGFLLCSSIALGAAERPNILLCVSDDQSWPHVGAAGDPVVKTPGFDRIAHTGALFTQAFVEAPSCTPSRGGILTGQHIWRLEEGGNLHSSLPSKFAVYPDILEKAGYVVGYSGKGWGPGRLEPGGRDRNPAGPQFRNFQEFLKRLPKGKPFCYWLGSHYPHRPYPVGSGLRSGKDPAAVRVPRYLPDEPIVRSDMLDYYTAIEKFDRLVVDATRSLETLDLLKNTLVVVTSDNGMPFPRAKATLYDSGVRVPLAIAWPNRVKEGTRLDHLAQLCDLAPTFLEAAGLAVPAEMTGRSLLPLLVNDRDAGWAVPRDAVFYGMERHDGARANGKGYPSRAVRTDDYLYIRNFAPDRWPAGDPDPRNCARALPFGEVDPSPTKSLLLALGTTKAFIRYFQLAFEKRPAEELYDLAKDPDQISNLASDPAYRHVKADLAHRLQDYLAATGDPRALGRPASWDHDPYYGMIGNPAWSGPKAADRD